MLDKKQLFFLKHAWKFRLAALTFVLLTAPAYATGPQELIAVLDLESDATVSKITIDTICNKIEAVIAADKRYTVFDRKFLPFTLQSIGVQKQKPCSTTSCLSELGRRIGAKYVIGGSVHLNKKEVTITLLRVDAEKGVILGTVTKKTTADKALLLGTKLPGIVIDLMKTNAPRPAEKGKKNFFAQPLVYIGGAAIVVVAAAVVYVCYAKGPGAPPVENDLSLGDAPQHTR
jgi:TolB-like protein